MSYPKREGELSGGLIVRGELSRGGNCPGGIVLHPEVSQAPFEARFKHRSRQLRMHGSTLYTCGRRGRRTLPFSAIGSQIINEKKTMEMRMGKKQVARMGIEPTTFALLARRSNQLS